VAKNLVSCLLGRGVGGGGRGRLKKKFFAYARLSRALREKERENRPWEEPLPEGMTVKQESRVRGELYLGSTPEKGKLLPQGTVG